MADKVLENNQVSIVGEIVSDFLTVMKCMERDFRSRSCGKSPEQLCRLHSTDDI